jgi:UDP-glucose-4-epimerase GalE
LIEGDIRRSAALREAMSAHNITAVIHFAGLIEVSRSVTDPDLFYSVNVAGTASLLDAMRDAGVSKLVFSSSASVYGHAPSDRAGRLSEDAQKAPVSPYGDTKLAAERMIAAYCNAYGLKAIALRYFNASGADSSGLIGESHDPETHLIPLAADAGLKLRPPLTVFGTDYPTPDGSCVRDYIHVTDLAAAHIAALDCDQASSAFEAFNIGSGAGYSVLEVIDAVSRALGAALPYVVGPRRAGDPPTLVADPARAMKRLAWQTRHSSLEEIVASAVAWRRSPAYGLFGRREAAKAG